ncbi:MAG: hypothetical protein K9H63_04190, partial [Sphingobacteriaceae bacterium]|nr:hypothetical protein [Sphingobacteriaceae bacterium]
MFKFLFTAVLAIALTWSLNHKWGAVPPLGKFLDPFQGFWKNAESKNTATENTLSLAGLKGEVTVQFDDQRIPHIFAE